jgi:hypothetical protein
VEELIRDSLRRVGGQLPFTRLALTSRNFTGKHAHMVRQLLRALGPRALAPLAEAAESILEGMPAEYELMYYGKGV